MSRVIVSLLVALHMALPIAVWAQMQAQARLKDPLDYPLKTYALILGVAVLGGFASWYAKVRKGDIPAWSIHHLMGELVTSALAGLLCWWLCEWAGFAPLLNAALAGIAGHMGARAITLIEEWALKRATNLRGN